MRILCVVGVLGVHVFLMCCASDAREIRTFDDIRWIRCVIWPWAEKIRLVDLFNDNPIHTGLLR